MYIEDNGKEIWKQCIVLENIRQVVMSGWEVVNILI